MSASATCLLVKLRTDPIIGQRSDHPPMISLPNNYPRTDHPIPFKGPIQISSSLLLFIRKRRYRSHNLIMKNLTLKNDKITIKTNKKISKMLRTRWASSNNEEKTGRFLARQRRTWGDSGGRSSRRRETRSEGHRLRLRERGGATRTAGAPAHSI